MAVFSETAEESPPVGLGQGAHAKWRPERGGGCGIGQAFPEARDRTGWSFASYRPSGEQLPRTSDEYSWQATGRNTGIAQPLCAWDKELTKAFDPAAKLTPRIRD